MQNVKVISTPTGKVGYFLFNDHIKTAERGLYDAMNQLSASGVNDLVLDVRYNGGGYLYIASELAYMIAGGTATNGKFFEKLRLMINMQQPIFLEMLLHLNHFIQHLKI